MACWDSQEIMASDSDIRVGSIADGYPGCGMCSLCTYENKYDEKRIAKAIRRMEAWYAANPHRYICTWTNDQGYTGTFEFRCSSLTAAREVAKASVFGWTSLLVHPFSVECDA